MQDKRKPHAFDAWLFMIMACGTGLYLMTDLPLDQEITRPDRGWLVAAVFAGRAVWSRHTYKRRSGHDVPPLAGWIALPVSALFGWLLTQALLKAGAGTVEEPAWALPVAGIVAAVIFFRTMTREPQGGGTIAGHMPPHLSPHGLAPGYVVIVTPDKPKRESPAVKAVWAVIVIAVLYVLIQGGAP